MYDFSFGFYIRDEKLVSVFNFLSQDLYLSIYPAGFEYPVNGYQTAKRRIVYVKFGFRDRQTDRYDVGL